MICIPLWAYNMCDLFATYLYIFDIIHLPYTSYTVFRGPTQPRRLKSHAVLFDRSQHNVFVATQLLVWGPVVAEDEPWVEPVEMVV